jgi:2-polyprenyl-6-methoxyphenol hydroxylase-like FAD-dependent oxidoreductase
MNGRLQEGETISIKVASPGRSSMRFRPSVLVAKPEKELRWLGFLGIRGVDLVVGADGLRSGVRRLAFGPDDVHVRPLGIYAGIYTAPNRIALQDWEIVFRAPDRGAIIYPTRDNSELRVALYIATRDADPAADDTTAQRRALQSHLDDIGGPIGTMIKELDRADDLYADGMAQVRMDTWSRGRVALVGDAAFCPSPLTGHGTSLALVGAYVLARELVGSIGHVAALALREAPAAVRRRQSGHRATHGRRHRQSEDRV